MSTDVHGTPAMRRRGNVVRATSRMSITSRIEVEGALNMFEPAQGILFRVLESVALIHGCFKRFEAEIRIAGFTRNICSTLERKQLAAMMCRLHPPSAIFFSTLALVVLYLRESQKLQKQIIYVFGRGSNILAAVCKEGPAMIKGCV